MVVSEVLKQLFYDHPIDETKLPMSISSIYAQYQKNIENQSIKIKLLK